MGHAGCARAMTDRMWINSHYDRSLMLLSRVGGGSGRPLQLCVQRTLYYIVDTAGYRYR